MQIQKLIKFYFYVDEYYMNVFLEFVFYLFKLNSIETMCNRLIIQTNVCMNALISATNLNTLSYIHICTYNRLILFQPCASYAFPPLF